MSHPSTMPDLRTLCYCSMACLISFALTGCGVGQSNNIFAITAENDFEDTTVVTSGASNPDVIIPVIINDKVVKLVDINFDATGQSGRTYLYDPGATLYNTDSQMSFHINGGNPNIPGFPDAADMAGSVSLTPGSDFTVPDTVQLTYSPASNAWGVDWFSYTPLGINGASDTAYAFVRYVRIAEDEYEPDDFIQFARDITDYALPGGAGGIHHRETHNSDYTNPDIRRFTAYRAVGGMSIRGDRDWYLIRLPTGANAFDITVKIGTPHEQDYSDRPAYQDTENELCITLIEEVSGIPPTRANGPAAQRYTQNPETPIPRPYWTDTAFGLANHLTQLNRNSKDGSPAPTALWFKWPLDDASGFPTTVGTGKVFVRINPRPTIYAPAPVYEPHGEYRIDFLVD